MDEFIALGQPTFGDEELDRGRGGLELRLGCRAGTSGPRV